MSYIDVASNKIDGKESVINSTLEDTKKELIGNIVDNENEKLQMYIDLIKKANLLFKERKYEGAKTIYREASELFPRYPYPKNQIVKIFDRLQRKKTRSKNKSNKRNIISKNLKKDFKGEFEDVLSKEFLDNDDD